VNNDTNYLMESELESQRLDIKTDAADVQSQANCAGLKPGMRVADVCCGAGKTSSVFNTVVGPNGSVVGIDGSLDRIRYAEKHYGAPGIQFVHKNILSPMDDLGSFDFVWIRFVLEYFRTNADEVVENASRMVKPGGILCLIDLDHNCRNHYGLSARLETTLLHLMDVLESKSNFDPYAGRKLYSHLYKRGYSDIAVDVRAHHIITGELKEIDAYNWFNKVEVIASKIDYDYSEYTGGRNEFIEDFKRFFTDPGRFTYTPIILCRGIKPSP